MQVLGQVTAHEAFSLMLQERLDALTGEVSELSRAVWDVSRVLRSLTEPDARIHTLGGPFFATRVRFSVTIPSGTPVEAIARAAEVAASTTTTTAVVTTTVQLTAPGPERLKYNVTVVLSQAVCVPVFVTDTLRRLPDGSGIDEYDDFVLPRSGVPYNVWTFRPGSSS